jgi:N-acetylneuraminic acid mutarotase/uncharacterized membrane protein
MKPILKFAVFVLLAGTLVHVSCKKEHSCENCGTNKPPVADAGPDQAIILPIDSVMLDGSASHDPDGTISSFQWTKITGPASFTVSNASAARTAAKSLAAGVYQFELKVTDNGGLSAKDTMRVIVNDPTQQNRPPVANAGPDQSITLPANSVNLDGSGSTDPDNNITSYAWTKISGPSLFNMASANAVQTQVTNLVQGVYQFELKVTDAGSLFSKDTMQLTVDAAAVILPCNNRPVISATLVQIGTLSDPGIGLVSATSGNKIFFAGGQRIMTGYSSRVDIYDIATNTWSTAELSSGDRMGMAAATVGNKILFAGGIENDYGTLTSRVDIYDGSTNSWSTAELSKARAYLAAATIGNKVFFAGGGSWEPYFTGSNVVDIYDNSTNTWSTATLSEGRSGLSATTAGNKIYFAGGAIGGGPGPPDISTRIDIYDAATNSWSTSELLEGKSHHASIAVAGKIYWGSGINFWLPYAGFTLSNQVEMRDINTGISSLDCMIPRYDFEAVTKGDNIIFFTGGGTGNPGLESDHFEIYNITTNTWSTAVLNQKIVFSAIISVNNTIYVAGGCTDNFGTHTYSEVWKLEF